MKKVKKFFKALASPDEEKLTSNTTHEPQSSSSHDQRKVENSSPLTGCIMKICKGSDKSFKPVVMSFLKANGEGWLENQETRDYLRTFLEKHEDVDTPSEAESYLKLYELCIDQNNFEDNQIEIKELMFDEEWEERLTDATTNETKKEFISKVKRECAIRLEKSNDFKLMRDDLKTKINISD